MPLPRCVRRPSGLPTLLTATWLAMGLLQPALAGNPDPALLAGLEARSIGPAGMSGRIAAIDAVAADPRRIWVGAATGGVWKSANGGLTWEPVFDDQAVGSVGALAIDQRHPEVVYVGTGEAAVRNSVSVGNGVYRTLDGGRHWQHLGLEATERISRVLLHPERHGVVYVAALGQAWGESAERGVYRSRDGGQSWEKVLFVDERTGAADLAMDPSNPDRMIAAMWDYRRWPWSFRSGGPGSGLFLTVDGGDHWRRLTSEDGLPKGELGRIGVAFAPSDPKIAYALVEAKKNVFLRSEDGGATWKNTGATERFGNRPFYFSRLKVDPVHPGRVYSLWTLISVSDDFGANWRVLVPFRDVHPDHHAMWIEPGQGRRIIAGNDGGIAISDDRGESWRFVTNLPLAQFYHVRVDDDLPYNVYGGLQDNGSWRGPAEVWENGGIRNHHWAEVSFGDGFDTAPDPRNSLEGYSMSQEGYLVRWSLATGEQMPIRPAAEDEEELRFNWNAALALDPIEPGTIYFGSQFVHRSRDAGRTWSVISPDLTSDASEYQRQAESGGLTPDVTGAENYTTLTALEPSPLRQGVLWAGSDDGRLHVTTDGGESWRRLDEKLRGPDPGAWIPHIHASRHEPGRSYVVLDDHRRSDQRPWLFRVDGYGERIRRVPTKGVSGFALAVLEDPRDPRILYLGTDRGLWISLDSGENWFRWTHGVPAVQVRDLAYQAAEDDLVIATHGRGLYVLDDLEPLRRISAETLAEGLHLFPPPPAQQHVVRQTGASRFPGHGEFRGENEPYGALITFSVNLPGVPHPDPERRRKDALEQATKRPGKKPGAAAEPATGAEEVSGESTDEAGTGESKHKKDEARITILDSEGREVRQFTADVKLGVNRVAWDLRRNGFARPTESGAQGPRESTGPEVIPGSYVVRVACQDQSAEARVEVRADPRVEPRLEEREAAWDARQRAGRMQERAADHLERIRFARADLDRVMARAERRFDPWGDAEPKPDGLQRVEKAVKKARQALDELEKLLRRPPGTKGITDDQSALGRIRRAGWLLGQGWQAPTQAQLRYLELAEQALDRAEEAVAPAFEGPLAEVAELAEELGLGLLSGTTPASGEADSKAE